MITAHAQQRMVERNITKQDLITTMKRGTLSPDWKGRPHVKNISFKDITIVLDMYSKDILTCWRR